MKIIIIGLGLIGGSIAKQLISQHEITILAYDSNKNSIQSAIDNSNIHGIINDLKKSGFNDFSSLWGVISGKRTPGTAAYAVSYTHLTLPTILLV